MILDSGDNGGRGAAKGESEDDGVSSGFRKDRDGEVDSEKDN